MVIQKFSTVFKTANVLINPAEGKKCQWLQMENYPLLPSVLFPFFTYDSQNWKKKWVTFQCKAQAVSQGRQGPLTFLTSVLGNFRIFSTWSGWTPSSQQLTLSSCWYVSSCRSSSISMKSFSRRDGFWILTLSTSSKKKGGELLMNGLGRVSWGHSRSIPKDGYTKLCS